MKVSPEHLRNKADYAEELGYRDHANLLRDAAETIDALGAPQDANPAIYVPRKSLAELFDKEGSHVAVPTLIHRKPLKSGNGVALYLSPPPQSRAAALRTALQEQVNACHCDDCEMCHRHQALLATTEGQP